MNLKQINTIVPGSMNSFKVTEDLNFALRLWKKALKENNIVQELHERKFYTKPSTIKKRQKDSAKYLMNKG